MLVWGSRPYPSWACCSAPVLLPAQTCLSSFWQWKDLQLRSCAGLASSFLCASKAHGSNDLANSWPIVVSYLDLAKSSAALSSCLVSPWCQSVCAKEAELCVELNQRIRLELAVTRCRLLGSQDAHYQIADSAGCASDCCSIGFGAASAWFVIWHSSTIA